MGNNVYLLEHVNHLLVLESVAINTSEHKAASISMLVALESFGENGGILAISDHCSYAVQFGIWEVHCKWKIVSFLSDAQVVSLDTWLLLFPRAFAAELFV